MRRALLVVPIAALAVALAGTWAYSKKKDKITVRNFTSVNIQYQGSKVWVPATFIVHKGDRVQIKLINNAPSGKHGFALDEYGIKATVFKGEPQTIAFTANTAGLFTIYCQIHKAHVGGQLLVLEK